MSENLILDTKIMFLCGLKLKIAQFLHFWGGHFEIQDGRLFLTIYFYHKISFSPFCMVLETNYMLAGVTNVVLYGLFRFMAAILKNSPKLHKNEICVWHPGEK